MSRTLFRQTVRIDTSEVSVVKFLGGETPVTLYVENKDKYADIVVSDRWGSPHSKVRASLEATGAWKLTVIEHPSDPRGIGAVYFASSGVYAIVVGASVLAWQVVAMLDGVVPTKVGEEAGDPQALRLSLPEGSDGSAPLLPYRLNESDGALVYEGDDYVTSEAVTVTVAHGASQDGPWTADAAATAALASVAAGSAEAYTFTVPRAWVRATFARDTLGTVVTLTAVRG